MVPPESLVLLISNLIPPTTTTTLSDIWFHWWEHFWDQIHVFSVCKRCQFPTFMSTHGFSILVFKLHVVFNILRQCLSSVRQLCIISPTHVLKLVKHVIDKFHLRMMHLLNAYGRHVLMALTMSGYPD
ncbi:uncharacterized protein LACBIDRAFT_323387 [Laccaria bicolor S238N-H82]|uniref:Predicted protein n=1 Tax=Laccaria bicolor (strain S238N-H82 / ATCC MYA-4686) TaxID=486041 RepID=B0CXG0_LACBS|nr:uncharacterized protein LACBIDRAFT_323387 [Laccaria bicolor S238N-H82]EDR12716.1 predicted protein [Laccaria bicolor S238N-H82]|eukprot:XP_001876980.1 predicted protein [Laccaria bicolor S238N-H82]